MIIVKIIGGIGNQLFQYAFAKALAQHNPDVFLDISDYRFYDDRQFDLACFHISLPIASEKQVAQFLPVAGRKAKIQRFFRDVFQKNYLYFQEKQGDFEENILKKYNENTYFDGYWQSYRYFEGINLKNDLTFKTKALEQNKIFIEKIQNSKSVSLHIRRGDYVNKADVNKIFRVLELDYYKKSIELISQKISPHFFVFSDDIDWAKEHLQTGFPQTFIDTQNPNFEDLRLMSLCKHHIIANSSFSWWGTWLNKNDNKIVLCPKKWYNENTLSNPYLIPDKWIKI